MIFSRKDIVSGYSYTKEWQKRVDKGFIDQFALVTGKCKDPQENNCLVMKVCFPY